MSNGYFNQIKKDTDNRLWINNPTYEEAKKALDIGAIACTTNPTFVARLLKTPESKEDALQVIDKAITEYKDNSKAAAFVQRKLIANMAEIFMPQFNKTNGSEGFVSIQMDPNLEEDPSKIVAEAMADFELFPNCIAKIPVTKAGLAAIDCLVRLNKPIIATEIMAISQAIAVCEVYKKASKESGFTPTLFVTHISGIFDEQIKEEIEVQGIAISEEALRVAGCAVAKKQYKIMQERNLPGILLGGGARGLHHFTELVGGNVHVTMNWKNHVEVLDKNTSPIINLLNESVPPEIIQELKDKSRTFALAYKEDGLSVDEFEDFSPVVRFRNQFLKGWNSLVETINDRRKEIILDEIDFQKILKLGENTPVEKVAGVMRSTLVYNNESMLCHFHEKSGAEVELHTHVAIQCGYVLKGKIKFYNEKGEENILEPGHGYLFNSNEPHGSVALEDSEIIEFFLPLRSEYID